MGAAFLHGAAVTIHKAQGSQWPDVQVFAPDLSAAAWSGRVEAGIPLWKRLAYVAITRAESRLLWVTRYALARPEAALMKARRDKDARRFGLATGLMHLAMVQILLGALVAGIDAGRSFTDWPLMAGQVFPMSAFDIYPLWRNFFENPALVQFLHRLAGYLLFGFGVVAWLRGRRSPNRATARAFDWMMVMLLGQVVLGIGTVLYAAPWPLALLHQLGAVALWTLILRARFLCLYPLPQSLRGRPA